jgi:hypothetical protein
VTSPGSLCRGDDYKSHVKCISEGQKYGGKGYEAKTHKGDAKQQAWIQVRVPPILLLIPTCFLLGAQQMGVPETARLRVQQKCQNIRKDKIVLHLYLVRVCSQDI